jgi:16S rRNA (cytosine1402-N4)-methyltransferase
MTAEHRDLSAGTPAEAVLGDTARHAPVLLDAVLAILAPREGAVYVDATFGTGGYSIALLTVARCRVFGIDRDPDAADDHRGALR